MTKINKKIIFSANSSWYLLNFRAATLERFIEEGHDVYCIAPKDQYSMDLITLGCKFIHLKMNNKGRNPFEDAILIYRIARIYYSVSPDYVFNFTIKNNIYGTFAAIFFKIKIFNHITGLGTAILRGGLLSKFVCNLYRSSQKFAHLIFCQNNEDKNFFLEKKLARENKIKLLPGSGVNIGHFCSSRELNLSNDQVVNFIYAGRIIADKGLIELIEAIKQINQSQVLCNLYIYGSIDSDNLSAIPEHEVKNWNQIPGVRWLGHSSSIKQVLNGKIDCAILPSYREGMPKFLLEAASMSLPIIATDVSGCNEIVLDGKNGFLCKPKDISSLQASILKMISLKPIERFKMGQNGRKIVEDQYTEDIVVNAAVDALNI